MQEEQKEFWSEIQKIQENVVKISLVKASKYDDVEMLLNDVTYETICSVMELIDGCKNKNLYGKIISKRTGHEINSDINLHDSCEEYLKCSDI